MSFWAWWVLIWLTIGIVSFLLIGLYFVRKEIQWGSLERKREIWTLLVDIIEFVENRPDITSDEVEIKVKEILQSLQLEVSPEMLAMLLNKQSVN